MIRWLLAQSLALTVAMVWPAPLWLGRAALGHPAADGPKHLWTLWWMRREALGGEPGLLTTLVNFPDGMRLFPIEPLNGALAVVLPLPVVPLSNALAMAHLLLTGLAAGWLGWEVTQRRAGAHVAAALFQCSAFAAFALQVGVGELRQLWWLPLGFAMAVRARRTRDRRWFGALGLTLALATMACFYLGFFLALGVAVWAIATMERAVVAGWVLAGAIAAAGVAPGVAAFGESWGGRATHEAPGDAATPLELVAPRVLDRGTEAQQAYGGGRYLGWVTLGLAAWGIAGARRASLPWVAVGCVGVICSFGTSLELAGQRVAMPLAWAWAPLAVIAAPPNFPARFVALACLALAVLAAMAPWTWGRAWLVGLAVADVAANDRVRWPRYTFVPPDVAALATAGGEGAVLDLTLVGDNDHTTRMRAAAAQIALDRPTQVVPVERVEAWATSGAEWTRGLSLARALARVHDETAGAVVTDARADAWLLREAGFDRVLLTWRPTGPDERATKLVDAAFGEPLATSPRGAVWAVPAVEATPHEAALWKEAHAARVAAGRGR
ncbi:MAG: hypothetical protein ACOZNI_12160 [Myxococcota bacterium]